MKKMALHYMRVLLVFVSLIAFQQLKAQFYTPTTADIATGVGVSAQPSNSGNDVQIKGSGTLHVMVWDGTSPKLAWNDNGSTGSRAIVGTTLGTVTDPDVVTDPSGSGRTLIVYTLTTSAAGSRIYYELVTISGATATTTISPTLLSSTNTNQNNCTNANVDVNSAGNIAVVYQSTFTGGTTQTMVYGKGSASFSSISFPSGATQGTIISSGLQLGKPSTVPDVSIQPNTSPLNATLVNVVFIYNNGSTKTLVLRQFTMANFIAGTGSATGNFSLESLAVAVNVGRPRIASTFYTGVNSSPADCHVVVQEDNNIIGYTHDASTYGAGVYFKVFENKDWGLNSCANIDPATSYVGDFIIDTWTYQDNLCGILTSKNTVVARQLTWNGVTHNPNYSILSTAYAHNNQTTSSIAGRFMTVSNFAYYLCWDQSRPDMIYKSSYYFNTSLKTGPQNLTETPVSSNISAMPFKVYPSPFQNLVNIDFSIADGELPKVVEAFDVSGKKVFTKDITNLSTGNNQLKINTDQWANGVYVLRVVTDQQTHTEKLVKD